MKKNKMSLIGKLQEALESLIEESNSEQDKSNEALKGALQDALKLWGKIPKILELHDQYTDTGIKYGFVYSGVEFYVYWFDGKVRLFTLDTEDREKFYDFRTLEEFVNGFKETLNQKVVFTSL